MQRLNKKSDRLQLLEYRFKNLIEKGYTQETYKDLNIFTKFDNDRHHLDVYQGTSTKNLNRYYYTKAERMQQAINNYKSNADRREKRKQEEKNNPILSTHSNCAKAIREELKLNFPNYKFSVTSDNFANGNAVRISWTDGPTDDQVDSIVSKYQFGHFNGMEDIYEYSNNVEGLPQVKFVSTTRDLSNDLTARLLVEFSKIYTGDNSDYRNSTENMLRRILNKIEIKDANNVVSIKHIDNFSGFYEDSFCIVLAQPEAETPEAQPTQKPEKVETIKGQVDIIDYSEKAFAVTGDTKPIKELLKELGGSFNPRLSCGAGWIFSKKKLDEVSAALAKEFNTAETESTKTEEVKKEILTLPAHEQTAIIEQIQEVEATEEIETFLHLDYLKIIWHEGRHIEGATFENTTFTTWNEVQKAFLKLWEVNEKGQDGGYTKVKCEIKLKGQETQTDRIDITNRIENGDFNPSQENICNYIIKNCDYLITTVQEEHQDEKVQQYDNIKDITEATESGKVISLFNLSQIINNKTLNA